MSARGRTTVKAEGAEIALLGEAKAAASGHVAYEVHTHSWTSGPRAGRGEKVTHSHVIETRYHRHADMGPACYTIDKDEWLAQTGLIGGGRKKFTDKPSGPQFDSIAPVGDEDQFEIIYDVQSLEKYYADHPSMPHGGGAPAAARMIQTFDMTPTLRIVR